jgi:hypothetical protein
MGVQDYHPPFNPLGREMLETVPDYCRSRLPNIDEVLLTPLPMQLTV